MALSSSLLIVVACCLLFLVFRCLLFVLFFFFFFFCFFFFRFFFFFFQAEDGIRDLVRSRGLGDVYKRQSLYTGLLVWNLTTTYWISNASLAGGLFANLANPALMSVPFMLARNTRKQFGTRLGYASLVFYWMAFESIHLSWELTWPWLSVGNVFAVKHTWIQWYEYTGVFGGTLWVWITNLLLFFILYDRLFPSEKINPVNNSLFKKYIPLFSLVLIIFIPILISKIIYNNYEEKGKPVNVTVLQPNFDPYKEKFDIPYAIQMEKMQGLSKQKLTDSTDYLVWPETSIQKDIWLDKIKYEKPVRDLSKLIDSFPNLTIVLGINGFERYTSQDASITARMEIIPRLPSKTSDTLFYDCLLYTSPSPRDRTRSRMPSSA